MFDLEIEEYIFLYFLGILVVILPIVLIVLLLLIINKIIKKPKIKEKICSIIKLLTTIIFSIFFMVLLTIYSRYIWYLILEVNIIIQGIDFSKVSEDLTYDKVPIFIMSWIIIMFISTILIFVLFKYLSKYILKACYQNKEIPISKIRRHLVKFFYFNQISVFILTTFLILLGIYISIWVNN